MRFREADRMLKDDGMCMSILTTWMMDTFRCSA